MNSTGALDLPDIPKTLLVVGGGYIGLELGSVYAALGSRVTVVEMTDGLLPGADRDLVNILAKRIEAMCEAVLLKTKVVGMKAAANGIVGDARRRRRADASGPSTACSSRSAAGRTPPFPAWIARASKSIGAGSSASTRAGGPKSRRFTPLATSQASRCSRTRRRTKAGLPSTPLPAIATSRSSRWRFPPWSSPIPELAWCGLTETDAEKQGRKVAVARFPWGASGRAITLGRTDGVTKLVLDPETGRVLGVGIVGAGAGELISEGVLAIEMGATARDVAMTIHPHPTLTETVMEAAEVFFGTATHVYRPKRA